jgi:hypothetical protein
VQSRRHFVSAFALVMGVATLWATFLHAIEASIWAVAFQFLGAIEALNGIILIGLTTAFLYGTIQRVWPVDAR